jgi:hypothetical protein
MKSIRKFFLPTLDQLVLYVFINVICQGRSSNTSCTVDISTPSSHIHEKVCDQSIPHKMYISSRFVHISFFLSSTSLKIFQIFPQDLVHLHALLPSTLAAPTSQWPPQFSPCSFLSQKTLAIRSPFSCCLLEVHHSNFPARMDRQSDLRRSLPADRNQVLPLVHHLPCSEHERWN